VTKVSHRLLVAAIGTACLLGPAAALPAEDLTISLPSIRAMAGAEVRVPISVDKAVDLGALEIDLAYDARILEFVSLEPGPMNTGMVESRVVQPGLLRIGSIAEPSLAGSGILFVAAFKVVASGKTTLEFRSVKANAGATGAEFKVAAQSGLLTVSDVAAPAGKEASSSWIKNVPKEALWIMGGLFAVIIGLLLWIMFLLGRIRTYKVKT
jgi:hypothetical protein